MISHHSYVGNHRSREGVSLSRVRTTRLRVRRRVLLQHHAVTALGNEGLMP